MPYKYKDIEKRLLRLGFKKIRQKGSHVLFAKEKIIFPVPNHPGKDISIGVEKNILKIIGYSNDDFRNIK